MAQLHETMYGKKLLEGDIPRIVKALETLTGLKPSLEALSHQGALVLTKELPEIRTSLSRIATALEEGNIRRKKLFEKNRLRRILNTVSTCTTEELASVIKAIRKDELNE